MARCLGQGDDGAHGEGSWKVLVLPILMLRTAVPERPSALSVPGPASRCSRWRGRQDVVDLDRGSCLRHWLASRNRAVQGLETSETAETGGPCPRSP